MSSVSTASTSTNRPDLFSTLNNDQNNDQNNITQMECCYREHNHTLKSLAILSRGIRDSNGCPIFDFDASPWKGLKTTAFKSKAPDYRLEIERRCQVLNITPAPRPMAWPMKKLIQWLDENPITELDDINFIRSTINKEKKK